MYETGGIMADVVAQLNEFAPILKARAPLAPYTVLKVGGPADGLAEPRTVAELQGLLRRCHELQIPWRVLGGGGNLLIRDEGVKGLVLRLGAEPFTQVKVQGNKASAGSGATLSALISQTTRQGLSGLESFVDLAGTVGGALRNVAGDRFGDLGQRVSLVEAVDRQGQIVTHSREELNLNGALEDLLLLRVEFELDKDNLETIAKRLRKAWIHRKTAQPHPSQPSARLFKNPPGLNASALIEQAGLVGTRVGGAALSDRDAGYVIVDEGASSRDILRLMDLVRTRVEERFHVELDSDLTVW